MSAFGPRLIFEYEAGYNKNRTYTRFRHHGGRNHEKSGIYSLEYGLQLSWNLFSGFADYQTMKMALAELSANDYAAAQLWLSVITDVRTAYEFYQTQIRNLDLCSHIRQMSLKTRDLVEQEYRQGLVGITRLNEVQRDLNNAENYLANARIGVSNAEARLNAAIGLNDGTVN